jgi:hypothetical protein
MFSVSRDLFLAPVVWLRWSNPGYGNVTYSGPELQLQDSRPSRLHWPREPFSMLYWKYKIIYVLLLHSGYANARISIGSEWILRKRRKQEMLKVYEQWTSLTAGCEPLESVKMLFLDHKRSIITNEWKKYCQNAVHLFLMNLRDQKIGSIQFVLRSILCGTIGPK